LQLLAVEDEVKMAFPPLLMDLSGGDRVVGPSVPDDAVAGAILSVGDAALEVSVLEWVVLGLDRESLLRRVVARALRAGPAREDAVDLEPQVVVEPGRIVLVHHEPKSAGGCGGDAPRCGLGGDGEVAFLAVLLEGIWTAGHRSSALARRSARHPRPRKAPW